MPASRSLFFTLILTLAMLSPTVPAHAHKIKIFAMTEGNEVTGYAYAPGGVRLPNNRVEIFAGEKKVGEVVTDANGEFRYTPTQNDRDLRFEMDTGDGHRTTFLISRTELTEGLPFPAAEPARPAAAVSVPIKQTSDNADLAALIDRAVAKNLRPLREQIEGYEQKVRFHDILGGIGYIMGLAGIFAYWQGGRERKKEREN